MDEKNDTKKKNCNDETGGLSRREWLIDVGKAAALAGIAGKSVALGAEGVAGPEVSRTSQGSLPPGLYSPSPEHLGHALVSDSRFHPIPQGCQVDFIRPRTGPFEPQYFSSDEYRVIHRLVALMLGESSAVSEESTEPTDGNIVDEVAEWIDLRTYSFSGIRQAAEGLTAEQVALANAYDGAPLLHRAKTTNPPQAYRNGLAWIGGEANRRHKREFLELTESQQTAILDTISDDQTSSGVENEGSKFFRQFKVDIISGFYTSRTGLKELDDKGNSFYAESPGCPASSPNHPKANS